MFKKCLKTHLSFKIALLNDRTSNSNSRSHKGLETFQIIKPSITIVN